MTIAVKKQWGFRQPETKQPKAGSPLPALFAFKRYRQHTAALHHPKHTSAQTRVSSPFKRQHRAKPQKTFQRNLSAF
nr:MAG TPA: hypothetical protein [Caudoviricetes sp.]